MVFAQDALIGEKRSGTAAWLLSKPVSRTAFLLAKLTADGIGILVTIVIVQGAIGYFVLRAATGISFQVPNFLAAMGLVAMVLILPPQPDIHAGIIVGLSRSGSRHSVVIDHLDPISKFGACIGKIHALEPGRSECNTPLQWRSCWPRANRSHLSPPSSAPLL